ncbi:MAG: hypothetical protein ACRDD1_03405 [Planctomycetia bacterium]
MVVGCGSRGPTSEHFNASDSMMKARDAFAAKDFDAAAKHAGEALGTGVLTQDAPAEAHDIRARSFVELKRFDEAIPDLDFLCGGEGDSSHLAMRGHVYAAKGEKEKARADFAMVRRANPRFRPPPGY